MCYQIAAGKAATKDGSVLVGRSCDGTGAEAVQIKSVKRQTHPKGEKI